MSSVTKQCHAFFTSLLTERLLVFEYSEDSFNVPVVGTHTFELTATSKA